MDDEKTIVAYKGFDKDLKCRGFQYEVGGEYETENAVVCNEGFHACAQPMEVFQHYLPKDGARYCLVEQGGDISRAALGTKAASTKLAVKAEIGIVGIVKAQIEWVREKKPEKTATGYSGTAAATGPYGTAAATGDYGTAAATGYSGTAAATGPCGTAAATGYSGTAAATGYSGTAAATGPYGTAVATGYRGSAAATGKCSAAMAYGFDGRVMGALGSALFAVERGAFDGNGYPILSVAAGIVDGEAIKADTWYQCRGGKLVEVEEDG